MANSFNVGDVVCLKSGGPAMTVTKVGQSEGETFIWVKWFNGTKMQSDTFPANAVEPAEDGGSGFVIA